jgi:hypothetical protein
MAESLMARATRALGALQKGNSFKNGKRTLNSASQQQWLDDIGGERLKPAAGSRGNAEIPDGSTLERLRQQRPSPESSSRH